METGNESVPIGFLLAAIFFTIGLAAVFIPILRKAMKDEDDRPAPKG